LHQYTPTTTLLLNALPISRFATTGGHALLDDAETSRAQEVPAIANGAPGVVFSGFNADGVGHAGTLYVRRRKYSPSFCLRCWRIDRKRTRLNSSHLGISYA